MNKKFLLIILVALPIVCLSCNVKTTKNSDEAFPVKTVEVTVQEPVKTVYVTETPTPKKIITPVSTPKYPSDRSEVLRYINDVGSQILDMSILLEYSNDEILRIFDTMTNYNYKSKMEDVWALNGACYVVADGILDDLNKLYVPSTCKTLHSNIKSSVSSLVYGYECMMGNIDSEFGECATYFNQGSDYLEVVISEMTRLQKIYE